MTTRTKIGITVAVLAATVAAGATALASAGHGMSSGMMRRVATAMIDDALDEVHATAEQRATIHAARDRLLAVMDAHHRARHARLGELLATFEGESFDADRLRALRQEVEAEHGRIADAIGQALGEVHAVLTPEQRKALADHVRAHRHPRH